MKTRLLFPSRRESRSPTRSRAARRAIASLVLGSFLGGTGAGRAHAAEPKAPPQRVGVLRLGFRGSVPGEIRRQFLQRIIEGLGSTEFQVFPVLEDAPSSCTTAGCLAEAAKRLRIDFLVAGTVEEHAKTYAVTLRLIEGRHGEEMGVHRDTCETCGADEATEKIGLAASALRSRLSAVGRQPSRFIVRSQPSGAELLVDGRTAGRTPLDLDLTPGEHQLRLSARGFEPLARSLSAVAGIDETLSLEMVPRPTRLPLKEMAYGGLALGVASLAAGAWALHVNERQLTCGDGERDANMNCPRQWSTANLGAILIGAGAAFCTLGGTWLYISRTGGGQEATATPAAATSVGYVVGVAGRL